MSQTLKDQYVAGLKVQGWHVVTNTRSYRGYLTFAHAAFPDRHYYVGTHGSLRVGRIYTTSIPVSPARKALLAERGKIGQNNTVLATQPVPAIADAFKVA